MLTRPLEYQGGSDDPVANRMLADVIKAAKSNNVPMDVSVKEWNWRNRLNKDQLICDYPWAVEHQQGN